jgi:phosphoglycerate dehydrogenase-like enzyme
MANSVQNVYLVWLDWPERCFCAGAADIAYLKSLVPKGSRVVRARGERAFLRELPKATHAIVWNFKKEWFALAPRLRLLATPAAGQEFVPTEGPRGVKIHFGGFHGEIMAESVAAFVLAWARGMFRPELRTNPWPRNELSDVCYEVAGTRAVVAGYGRVGRAVGAKLESLGVSVAGVTRHGVFSGGRRLAKSRLPRLLGSADWFVMALPSTTGTDDFLSASTIAKLPRRCVVVNVGRGNAIDERALFRALKSRRLAGACLDVRRHEPSASVLEAPGYVPELADLPNCVVTPHSSAFSPRYLRRCFAELRGAGLLR